MKMSPNFFRISTSFLVLIPMKTHSRRSPVLESHVYSKKEEILKCFLRSLAFAAFVRLGVTSDPGVLFVVLNLGQRGSERVFWEYMSVDFIRHLRNVELTIEVCCKLLKFEKECAKLTYVSFAQTL